MALLTVCELRTAFSTGSKLLPVVRGVSFDLERGETLGLVGESGCGKSVTALSIVRLLPPSGKIMSGSVIYDGVELTSASKRALRQVRGRHVAMVFQDSMTSLNPLLTVGRQIAEGIEFHRGSTRKAALARAGDLLEEVGVPEPGRRLRQYPHQLSGGLRQRVAIAAAIGSDPELLIADEPTTALDVTTQAQLLDLLKREQAEREMATILITHDLGVIARMSDRVCVMYAGRIVEQGNVDEVLKDSGHPYTEGLLRSVPRLDAAVVGRLPSLPGAPPTPGALGQGCAFAPRCSERIGRCDADPALEPVGDDGHTAACWMRGASRAGAR
jgi:oligopeptide/dipeptide ABC transporter ATP-binding protein